MRKPFLAFLLFAGTVPASAQVPPNSQAMRAAQRAAMARIAYIDGVWRGPAWSITPGGRREVIQTERIGPFLDGTVKVSEGLAYNPDFSFGFNALGIFSYDPRTQAYTLHSHAQGYAGDFTLKLPPPGYVWEVPGGPGAVIRYTAAIGDGAWRE